MRIPWNPEYYETDTWKTKRNAAMKSANFCCERCEEFCFENVAACVHHKTYDRFGGWELPEDLEALCNYCHAWRHKKSLYDPCNVQTINHHPMLNGR